MTDQKTKTKKAILGELESISSLLQINGIESEIDSNEIDSDESSADEEPPLLTAMADDDIEFSDDFAESPLLTDALNSVINAIEGRPDEDDIPTLADSVPMPNDLQTKSAKEERFAGDFSLDLNEISGSEAHDEDDIVSRALKSKLHQANSIAAVTPTVQASPSLEVKDQENSPGELPDSAKISAAMDEDFSLPELVINEQDQEEHEETNAEVITPSATNTELELAADAALVNDIPSFGEVEAPTSSEGDLKTLATKNIPAETNGHLKTQTNNDTLNAEQIKSLRKKTLDLDVLAQTEHQPSLFDVAPTSSKSKTSKRTSDKNQSNTSHSPAIAGDRKKTINANNPFLPKHIRDRLHTNRTLQQEIDDSPYIKAPISAQNDQHLKTNQAGHSEPENPTDEMLVDELLSSYIAKIEPELRDKIRKLIKQEKQTGNK